MADLVAEACCSQKIIRSPCGASSPLFLFLFAIISLYFTRSTLHRLKMSRCVEICDLRCCNHCISAALGADGRPVYCEITRTRTLLLFVPYRRLMMLKIDCVSVLDSLKSAPPKFGRRMLLPIVWPILAALLNSSSSAMLNNVSVVHMSAPIAPFLIDSSLIQLLHSRNSVTAVAPCSTRTAQLLLDSIYVIT